MVKLLEFLNENGDKVELNAEVAHTDILRIILSQPKMKSYVTLISKKELTNFIIQLDKLQSEIPESPESLMEKLLDDGKKLSDLDNKTLLSFYKSQEVTLWFFSCIRNEIIRRLS